MTVAGQFKQPTVQPREVDTTQPQRLFNAGLEVAKARKPGITSVLEGLNDGIALTTSLQQINDNELIMRQREVNLEKTIQAQEQMKLQKEQERQVLEILQMPDGPDKLSAIAGISRTVTPETMAAVGPAIKMELNRMRYADPQLGQLINESGLKDQYFPEQRIKAQEQAHDLAKIKLTGEYAQGRVETQQAGAIIRKGASGSGSSSGRGGGAGTSNEFAAGINAPEMKELEGAAKAFELSGVMEKIFTKYGARGQADTKELKNALIEGLRAETNREKGESLVVNNQKYPSYENYRLSIIATYLGKYSEKEVDAMLNDADITYDLDAGDSLLSTEQKGLLKKMHLMARAANMQRQGEALADYMGGESMPSVLAAISSPRQGAGFGGTETPTAIQSPAVDAPMPTAPTTQEPGGAETYGQRQQRIVQSQIAQAAGQAEERLAKGDYPDTLQGRFQRKSDEMMVVQQRDQSLARNATASDKRVARRTRKLINDLKVSFPEAVNLTGSLNRPSEEQIEVAARNIVERIHGRGRGTDGTAEQFVQQYILAIKHMLKFGE